MKKKLKKKPSKKILKKKGVPTRKTSKVPTKSRILDSKGIGKSSILKNPLSHKASDGRGKIGIKKSAPNKKFKKHGEEPDEHKGWVRDDENWEKDGLTEKEETGPTNRADVDKEDEWIETKGETEDEEELKVMDENLLENEDKDNY